MEREKIELLNKDFKDIIYEDSESEEFEIVHEEITYTDLGKSYENKDVILKRASDNKYFKFSARFSSDGFYSYSKSIIGKEVFPVKKTITVYE